VRDSRHSSFGLIHPYIVGAALGGIATGSVSGLGGALVSSVASNSVLLALFGAVGLGVLLAPYGPQWPQSRHQVPRWWVNPPTRIGMLLAGIVLGSGVFTYVGFTSFYLALAGMLTLGSHSLIPPMILGALYGVAGGTVVALLRNEPASFLVTSRAHSLIVSSGLKATRFTGLLAVLVSCLLLRT